MSTQAEVVDNTTFNYDALASKREAVFQKLAEKQEFQEEVGEVREATIIDFGETDDGIDFILVLPGGSVGVISLKLRTNTLDESPAEEFLKSVGGSLDPVDALYESIPIVRPVTRNIEWLAIYGDASSVYEQKQPSTKEQFWTKKYEVNIDGTVQKKRKVNIIEKITTFTLFHSITIAVTALAILGMTPHILALSVMIAFTIVGVTPLGTPIIDGIRQTLFSPQPECSKVMVEDIQEVEWDKRVESLTQKLAEAEDV